MMPRPARSASMACERVSMEATAEPTVPNPARPTFSGSAMVPSGRDTRLTAFGKRNDVVQLFRRAFKEATDVARGLANALLVFDQRDADIALAIFPEADTGRNRNARLLDQERREFDAADALEGLRQGRPGEHGGPRRRHLPARAAKGIHQHVTPPLVNRAHLPDAL